jgi:thiol:disulfide interchange protein/DsbC/DsbD-like thiol-disulfide interchange protein
MTSVSRLRLLGAFVVILFVGGAWGCKQSDTGSGPHLTARLIADQDSLSPGSTFTLGVKFNLEPGWHIYWKNPGDSGLPPRFTWSTDPAVTVLQPLWPYPERLATGPLVNYGYSDVMIPFPARLAATARSGATDITLGLQWLVCKDECLPGEATLRLSIPINTQAGAPSAHRQDFEDAFARVPIPLERVSIAVEERPEQLIIALIPLDGRFLPPTFTFFPEDKRVIANAKEQKIDRDGDSLRITLGRDPLNSEPLSRIRGVLVAQSGWNASGSPHAVSIDTNPSAPPPPDLLGSSTPASASQNDTNAIGFATVILFACLGGLLLNIMPCVFPVLSIKILSFLEHSGHDPRTTRRHGLAFSLGVLVSFWIVAAILLTVRVGGEQLGWGFQLQSPTFVVVMMVVFLSLALLFLSEISVGQTVQSLAGRFRVPTSLLGSFLNGALATAVATPCTAPYMSTALAATLTLPPLLSLLVFTAIGCGMSAPYLLLSYRPELLRYLPKPGAWMVVFKELMAFPLFASVVWLARVFARQMGLEPPGLDVVVNVLWGLLAVSFGFWLWSRGGKSTSQRATSFCSLGALLMIALGVYVALPHSEDVEESRARACTPSGTIIPFTDAHGLLWESYSEERLVKVLAQGRPVFLDFTAEWCITCQVNEKIVFSSEEVRDLIIKKNVTLMRADWTSKNPMITNALRRFGRNGVPLNVIIASPSAEPVILPNILTPSLVRDELQKLP